MIMMMIMMMVRYRDKSDNHGHSSAFNDEGLTNNYLNNNILLKGLSYGKP